MLRLLPALALIRHHMRSRKWNSFHSPYLFRLFTYCCDDEINFPSFALIEKQRRSFLRSVEVIQRHDFGAGSQFTSGNHAVQISSIAKSSLSLPFQCRFMSRLARWTAPNTIVEFGTSLGIASAYIATGSQYGHVITIEGDPVIAEKAILLHEILKIKNIKVVNQKFDSFLNSSIAKLNSIDLLFIDGNHRAESLHNYYHALSPFFNEKTIVIIDDIYWSKNMQSAWCELIARSEVTQSVDCFHFGILFFNPDFLTKENHSIRLPFRSITPW